MAVGVLVNALIVRSVLVPCLLVLVGTASGWPGPHFRQVGSQERARARPGPAAPAEGG